MSPEGFQEVNPEYPENVAAILRELVNAGHIDASEEYVFSIHDAEARAQIGELVEKHLSQPNTEDKVKALKKLGGEITAIIDSIE